jgi:predicted nucleotidyltransferase
MKHGKPMKRRKLDPAALADIVGRIVKVAQPEQIILFGSAARGEMGPNSDVDLLVVKSGHFDRGRLTEQLYMHMEGADEAVDIVIATPEELRDYGESPWLVLAPALKEGRVVYAA